MITATEAKALMNRSAKLYAEDFEAAIRWAAKKNNSWVVQQHNVLSVEAADNTETWQKFVTYMKTLGFEVSFNTQGIMIKW